MELFGHGEKISIYRIEFSFTIKLNNYAKVSSGTNITCIIKTDGTLWTCGYNGAPGSLGIGGGPSKSSPVQVGTLTNWKEVSAGNYHGSSIKTDGTLWTWGYNAYGNLGLGDLTNRSSPVQVGALTDWKDISSKYFHSAAIKTDGSLWVWGYNLYGQLGLGDDNSGTDRSSPVQVGTLTNWKQISTSYSHTMAVKTDGTLWAWGYGLYKQLGLGDIVSRSSPVQVGTLTNWKHVSAGYYHSLAVKTDGTLWAWGYDAYGNLGFGDTIDRFSPVQVGSLSDWKSASAGNLFSAALRF